MCEYVVFDESYNNNFWMLNKSVTCQLETGSYGNSSKVTSDTDKLVNIKCIKHVKHLYHMKQYFLK